MKPLKEGATKTNVKIYPEGFDYRTKGAPPPAPKPKKETMKRPKIEDYPKAIGGQSLAGASIDYTAYRKALEQYCDEVEKELKTANLVISQYVSDREGLQKENNELRELLEEVKQGSFNIEIKKRDIATIEELHDVLLDLKILGLNARGFIIASFLTPLSRSLIASCMKESRELVQRMYEALKQKS